MSWNDREIARRKHSSFSMHGEAARSGGRSWTNVGLMSIAPIGRHYFPCRAQVRCRYVAETPELRNDHEVQHALPTSPPARAAGQSVSGLARRAATSREGAIA